ncbi:MAG: RNA methyltransferase [Ruminococcaceae bacterium]|nr:RNA methyltransferase [Oscillospiraceae bacterium]
MKKENNKFNESDIMEGMSSISAVIKAIEAKSTDRRIICVYIDSSKKNSKRHEIGFLLHKSKELGFSVEFTDADSIAEFTTGSSHGGIIAFCTPRNIPELSQNAIKKDGIYYYLEGVEDPYNFGYAVRSIYAAGGNGIILSPRNWMGVAGVVARSSAGTSELIDMFISEPEKAVDTFKQNGFTVICAGIRDSVSLFETDLKKPIFVVIGGEKRGISRAILERADKIVRIDYGNSFNGSLSTAAASAVFAFEIFRNNK